MSTTQITTPRVAVIGRDESANARRPGFALWTAGYAASVTAAGGEPVSVRPPDENTSWSEALEGIDGVILAGSMSGAPAPTRSVLQPPAEVRLASWCREHQVPILAVDDGLHLLNAAFGGTLYEDINRELPNALQHRHPPERGLRHAILVERGTRLATLYGEGEVVVNSEHPRCLNRIARGFLVSARALDGVVEGIETEEDDWFAVGVQWKPASTTASGLDIQLFRGLVEASKAAMLGEKVPAPAQASPAKSSRAVCAAA